MYTIGEFARLGSVSVRMLRHYDAIGLLRPAAVDQATGYRGYAIAQLGELNRILALRDLGFSLAEIGILLGDFGGDRLREMLVARSHRLREKIERARASLSFVEARLASIEQRDNLIDDVVIRSLPAIKVLAIPRAAPGAGPEKLLPVIVPAFRELSEICKRGRVVATGSRIVFYTRAEDGGLIAHMGFPIDDAAEALPPQAELFLLPPIAEAACVVRTGTATEVFSNIYVDLRCWMNAIGFECQWPTGSAQPRPTELPARGQ